MVCGMNPENPVIVIASDLNQLPDDPLLSGIAKSAGGNHLLYPLYGVLSEPASSHSRAQTIC